MNQNITSVQNADFLSHFKSSLFKLSTMWIIIIFLNLFANNINVICDITSKRPGIFTAVAPKVIFPNSVYNVTIITEDGESPTIFTALISSGNKSYAAQEMKIDPGESKVLSLDINDLDAEINHNLTIKTDKNFEEVVTIFLDRKNLTVIIQTDKPIYKPGETIRFRVLVLDRFLKPYEENQITQVKVYDPQRNVIKIWKNAKVSKGLLSTELKLSDEPNLGDWTIEAATGGQTANLQISVAHYVLPKFNVEVKLPNFITLNSSKVAAEIKAMYTYGKELKGECTVTLSPKNYYFFDEPLGPIKHSVSKTMPINGKVIVEFDSIRDNPILFHKNEYFVELEYEVVATVRDEITGKEQNGSSTVKMYEHPYKIEYIDQATSFQPGLPLKMTFKVASQDNIPIEDSAPEALSIMHGFAYNWEDSIIKSPIPSNGIVSFTFVTPSNDLITVNSVEIRYKNLKRDFYLPQKMHSPTRTYIQLNLVTENTTVGKTMKLNLKATHEFSSLNYIIYGSGKILLAGKLDLENPTKEYNFELPVLPCAAPEGKLVVYSIFGSTNEIVAANLIKFTAGFTLNNKLNIKLSDEVLEPGQNLTISMNTHGNSLVAVRGIDQSVLILKEDKDITIWTLDNLLKEMEQSRNEYNRIWGGSSSFQIFEQASLVILTNGFLERDRSVPYYPTVPFGGEDGLGGRGRHGGMMMRMEFAAPMADLEKISGSSFVESDSSSEIRVRKDFPETWLWEEFWVNEQNNSFRIDKIVPDTLTSWIITGYSLNSEVGVGISLNPQKLTTFRPFFISLNLPYSVVQGEVLSLKVLVHNYMSSKIKATIIFDNKEGKLQVGNEAENDIKSKSEKIAVGPYQVSSVTFVIVAKEIGTIMLLFKGVTSNAGDALSQPLLVKPPGHKQTRSNAVLLDLRTGSKSEKRYNLTADFPNKRVADADSVKITLIADILGASISKLDNLLEMPCGCGEQNMLNFVPDIVILDYLTKSGILTADIQTKAISFLESGYQRELTYRHYDGSFSAFGNSDSVGSTWLTAFVVRSFMAAKSYITIDNEVISQALNFLAQHQNIHGKFKENGLVLHSDMQGGSSSDGLALTAYTLLAFLEYSNSQKGKHEEKYVGNITKGLDYISQSSHFKSGDLYALNLVAYTLEIAKHAKRDAFFDRMASKATQSGDTMHWETKIKQKEKPKHQFWEPEIKPVTVEMTAYALMTYIRRNQMEESLKIVRWLLLQRNAEGGFLSTQDTVVGLSSLAMFAVLTRTKGTDLTINVKYTSGEQAIKVDNENAILLQEFYLPATVRSIDLKVTGKGTALAQLTWNYYIKEESSRPAFKVTIEAESLPPKLRVNVCASYSSAGNESNMAVMEVNTPSGYSIDSDNLSHLKKILKMKRLELQDGDTKLIIYFDAITKVKVCANIVALRVFSVGKQAPSYVLVYDYYDTTKKARAFYDLPNANSQACGSCEDDDENCEKKCYARQERK